MTIRTDQREIPTDPRPELHRAARAAWRAALEHELKFAALFGQILECQEYAEQGASSLVEYARRLGYHGGRAIVQARLGQAIRLRPELADRLRARTISIENAETIASALLDPATRDVEDWLALAEHAQGQALRHVVAQGVWRHSSRAASPSCPRPLPPSVALRTCLQRRRRSSASTRFDWRRC